MALNTTKQHFPQYNVRKNIPPPDNVNIFLTYLRTSNGRKGRQTYLQAVNLTLYRQTVMVYCRYFRVALYIIRSELSELSANVNTMKGRSVSSTRWLARQLNDPYVKRAASEGYRSRAVYKLLEINEKYRLLSPGKRVVDLGCAPGSWSQLAASLVRSTDKDPLVFGVDCLASDPIPGVVLFLGDAMDSATWQDLFGIIGQNSVDVVLSDMGSPATGHGRLDHLRSMRLCEAAASFSYQALRTGGCLLSKMIVGDTESDFCRDLRSHFSRVLRVKPKASRAKSSEMYILATGFRTDADKVTKVQVQDQ